MLNEVLENSKNELMQIIQKAKPYKKESRVRRGNATN